VKGMRAMKILKMTLMISLFACIGVTSLFGGDQDTVKSINALIHQVYKEKMKNFDKFNCKETRSQILNYYDKYFTQATALYLTNLVEYGKNKFNEGAFAQDPRYSDEVSSREPDDPWMHDEYRVIKKITFLVPIITGSKSVAQVDTIVESNNGRMMRSEFHLIKVGNNWKIGNIIWGSRGAFDEKSTQALSSIKPGDFQDQISMGSNGL